LRFGGHGGQRETQGIGSMGVDDVHWVDAVPSGLAHSFAMLIEDGGVDGDVEERNAELLGCFLLR
jgi:hypothetical protein